VHQYVRVVRRGVMVAGLSVVGMFGMVSSDAYATPERVYEQVSPADKGDANIIPNDQRTRAASGGEAVQFASLIAFGDAPGAGVTSEYIAKRGPDGHWTTHGITPSQEPLKILDIFAQFEPGYVGEFSADLSRAVYLANSPLTNAPNVAATLNLYLRRDMLAAGSGRYELLSDATTLQNSLSPFVEIPLYASASADFSHVIFESTRNLTADAVTAALPLDAPKLYEWVDGTVRLAGILPVDEGGGPTPSQAGQENQTNGRYAGGTISSNGQRVIFTAAPFSPDHTAGGLYLRDDQGTSSIGDDVSVRVNASERTDCSGDPSCGGDGVPDPAQDPSNPDGVPRPATFWAASDDASVIYFTTQEELTDNAGNGLNLYQYRLDRPAGSRLTLIRPGVSGVVGASNSGDYVYYGVSAVTGPGDPGQRIYVWHDGTSREVGAVNNTSEYDSIALRPQWGAQPRSARVSPDGTHLVFVTQGSGELLSLYGKPEYDQGQSCPLFTDLRCDEVYLYDATANGGNGDLRCASCNPSGLPPTHDADFRTAIVGTGAARDAEHLSHVLSDDGRYVFFNTADRLAPDDQDDSVDAYQFDSATGEVSLLSSGTESQDEYFLDASADGRDAFIISSAQLSATDIDHARDIYDARIGGIATKPKAVPIPCGGESCRRAATGGVQLTEPPTVRAGGPKDRIDRSSSRAVFSVRALTGHQRHVLARRGRAQVIVAASQAGVLTLRAKARIGSHSRALGNATRRLRRAGLISLPLQLSGSVRDVLTRTGKLRLTIIVTYSHAASPQVLHLMLRSPHA
jgi:hypothetical protein